MPVIYFSKRERIIKKMNRIRQWMRWKGKKTVELEKTISMPSNTLYGDNETNHLAKKN